MVNQGNKLDISHGFIFKTIVIILISSITILTEIYSQELTTVTKLLTIIMSSTLATIIVGLFFSVVNQVSDKT